jgi:hypothetical protein
MNRIKLALGWLLGCNLSDFITTKIGLSFPNVYETNKFCVSLGMNSIWYYLFKLGLVSSTGFLIYFCYGKFTNKTFRYMMLVALLSMGTVFGYCAVHNLLLIKQYL